MKKDQQLGMNHSSAATRLRKLIFFQLIQQANRDTCFRCGLKITNINELNIDHKKPWLDEENAIELFFDLDNITFSHARCNHAARRKEKTMIAKYESVNCSCCNNLFSRKAKYFKLYRKKGRINFFCSIKCSNIFNNKLRVAPSR